jgi:hypothetical protein
MSNVLKVGDSNELQIKQSLQLCDFLGNSANAVRWQVWTALLLYVLMHLGAQA